MIDPLIDELVGDLRPIKPMQNWFAWALAMLGFTAISAFVILYYGLREDFGLAMSSGTIIWKNGGLMLAALAAAIATITLSRPHTAPPRTFIIAILSVLLGVIGWRLLDLARQSSLFYEVTHVNFGGAGICIPVIIGGGILVFGTIWLLWLNKSASQNPRELGAAAGLLSGLLAASAYAFHCNMDNIFYFIFVYWLPIIGFGVFGYLIGAKLKW